jgi:hypothetical protein
MFIRFTRQFVTDLLCSLGWHDSLCMIEYVVVGFRYILKVNLLCSLMFVKSR